MERTAVRSCAVLLALAALLALLAGDAAPPVDLLDSRQGPPTRLPDLARDGAAALSWLPGVGAGRARALVRERPRAEGGLTPARLQTLPGVGAVTAEAVAEALAAWQPAAPLEWSHDDGGGGP